MVRKGREVISFHQKAREASMEEKWRDEVVVLDEGLDNEEVMPTAYSCCWGAYSPFRY